MGMKISDLKNKAYGKIKLVFPTEEYKEQVEKYLQEFFENGEFEIAGDGELDKIKDFELWLKKVKNNISEETVEKGRVPSTVFLAVRKDDNEIIGNIQIRHRLNDYLLQYAGHMGDSVRPSQRGKGYATEMIRLALEECRKLGIDKVLMTCSKDNIASRKTIEKNGAILENEVLENDNVIQRFWIDLKK